MNRLFSKRKNKSFLAEAGAGAIDAGMNVFYTRLKPLLDAKQASGISYRDMARQLGIEERRFGYFVQGRDYPLELIPSLCRFLGTHPNYLFGFSPDVKPKDLAEIDRQAVIEKEIRSLAALLREFRRNS